MRIPDSERSSLLSVPRKHSRWATLLPGGRVNGALLWMCLMCLTFFTIHQTYLMLSKAQANSRDISQALASVASYHDRRLTALEQAQTKVADGFSEVNGKLAQLGDQTRALNTASSGLDKRIAAVEHNVASLGYKVKTLEPRVTGTLTVGQESIFSHTPCSGATPTYGGQRWRIPVGKDSGSRSRTLEVFPIEIRADGEIVNYQGKDWLLSPTCDWKEVQR